VLELISAAVRGRVEALRGEFQSAKPFRHLVIDEFLTPELCRQLMAGFPPFDTNKARNELGEVGGKAVFTNLPRLGPAYARLDKGGPWAEHARMQIRKLLDREKLAIAWRAENFIAPHKGMAALELVNGETKASTLP